MSQFLPRTLQGWLSCLLLLTLTAAALPLSLLGWRFYRRLDDTTVRNLINSAQNLGDSATLNANAYGAVADGTTRTLERHVNPAIDRISQRVEGTMLTLQGRLLRLDDVLASLTAYSRTLDALTANTDQRINGDSGLLAESAAAIRSVRLLTEGELKNAVAEFALAGRNVRLVTEAPELQTLPSEIDALAKSLNRSAGSVEIVTAEAAKATANIEGVTGNLEKISEDVQKRAHTLLNPPPSPWWKKYILTPLKEIGGVTYLTVRILNSAN